MPIYRYKGLTKSANKNGHFRLNVCNYTPYRKGCNYTPYLTKFHILLVKMHFWHKVFLPSRLVLILQSDIVQRSGVAQRWSNSAIWPENEKCGVLVSDITVKRAIFIFCITNIHCYGWKIVILWPHCHHSSIVMCHSWFFHHLGPIDGWNGA